MAATPASRVDPAWTLRFPPHRERAPSGVERAQYRTEWAQEPVAPNPTEPTRPNNTIPPETRCQNDTLVSDTTPCRSHGPYPLFDNSTV